MATVAILRTRNGVPESADAAYLTIRDGNNLAVYGEALVPPSGVGTYSVTLNLGAGPYTAYWRFLIAGFPEDRINRLFYLDAPMVITEGITLMQIERNVARRIGPYIRVQAEATSSYGHLYSHRLVSSLSLGTYEDQFLLRRGVNIHNLRIPYYDPDDRVRLIAEYDTANGRLKNDRAWTLVPDAGNEEMIEIQYLDPDLEMRPSTLDGLRRCFFWDTTVVTLTEPGYATKIPLNRILPWVINPSQVREVSYAYGNTMAIPKPVQTWKVTRSGKNLYLWTQGTSTGSLSVLTLRPVFTLVNEETTLSGPNDDLDMVYAEMDYVVWAIIVELWKNQPERLQPLIKEGLRTDLKAAAAEFTKKSLVIANQQPERVQIDFGSWSGASTQVGNLPEMAV